MTDYENLKKELIHLKKIQFNPIWTIYHNDEFYIKVLKSKSTLEKYGFIYLEIINTLNNITPLKGLPRIQKIWHENGQLLAYKISKMPGIALKDAIANSSNPLVVFYQFLNSVLPIIQIGEEHDIVFKDIITKGNVLYDEKEKRASIVDMDGFQVGMLSDRGTNIKIVYCHKYNELFNNPKYHIIPAIWTKEINLFSLYELFFNTVFNDSLLLFQKEESLEAGLKRKLTEKNFSPSLNIYARVLDLMDLNTHNSLDLEDFKYLSENYSLDLTRKRIIKI